MTAAKKKSAGPNERGKWLVKDIIDRAMQPTNSEPGGEDAYLVVWEETVKEGQDRGAHMRSWEPVELMRRQIREVTSAFDETQQINQKQAAAAAAATAAANASLEEEDEFEGQTGSPQVSFSHA
jgi:hypothetical protein